MRSAHSLALLHLEREPIKEKAHHHAHSFFLLLACKVVLSWPIAISEGRSDFFWRTGGKDLFPN
jgi:hypothetical protein